MRTYSVNGKGHKMLARLEEGPTTRGELQRVAVPEGNRAKRTRLHRLLDAMKADGFAVRIDGEWVMTDQGADALQCLRAGYPVQIQPKVDAA